MRLDLLQQFISLIQGKHTQATRHLIQEFLKFCQLVTLLGILKKGIQCQLDVFHIQQHFFCQRCRHRTLFGAAINIDQLCHALSLTGFATDRCGKVFGKNPRLFLKTVFQCFLISYPALPLQQCHRDLFADQARIVRVTQIFQQCLDLLGQTLGMPGLQLVTLQGDFFYISDKSATCVRVSRYAAFPVVFGFL